MRSIEFLIVFTVAALDLAVVPGRVRADEFVPDTELGKRFLKECRTVGFGAVEPVGELRTIVSLDTRNGIRELLNNMTNENAGRIGAVFLKGLEIAETGILIDEGVLVKLLTGGIADQASRRNKLDVDLAALSGIGHLLIRLGNIFGIGQFDSHLAPFAQESVKTRNGSGIPSLPKLDPKHHQTGVGVPAAHIVDELDLFRPVLVGMMMRAVGTVCQGLQRSVVTLAPAVDILAVGVVAYCCFRDAVFGSIQNQGLPEAHGLCYLIHSG